MLHSTSAGRDRGLPLWKIVAAGAVAVVGICAMAYTVWPAARPEPPRPWGSMPQTGGDEVGGGGPRLAVSGDAGEQRSASIGGAGPVPRVIPGGGGHGTPRATIVATTEPPDLRAVPAERKPWELQRLELGAAIEQAALKVDGLTPTASVTAVELGRVGSTAIMSALVNDATLKSDGVKSLGAQTEGTSPEFSAAGPIGGLVSGCRFDLANVRVLKPGGPRAEAPAMPPPEPGQPRRVAINMNTNMGPEGVVSELSMMNDPYFPATSGFGAAKLPAWEVRVPVELVVDGETVPGPVQLGLVIAKEPKGGAWQPAAWSLLFTDERLGNSLIKKISAQGARRRTN